MWLYIKRAINDADRAKNAYDEGRTKVAEVSKLFQDHSAMVGEKEAVGRLAAKVERRVYEVERQAKDAEDSLAEKYAALEVANEVVQVVLDDWERTRAREVDLAFRQIIAHYCSSEEFTILLDKEVDLEMADLICHFKRFNPGQKLNLNFTGDFPPLPEEVTEESIEAYEGEDAISAVAKDDDAGVAAWVLPYTLCFLFSSSFRICNFKWHLVPILFQICSIHIFVLVTMLSQFIYLFYYCCQPQVIGGVYYTIEALSRRRVDRSIY